MQDDVKGKGKALARSWSSPGSNLLEEQHVPSVAAPAVEPHRAAAALPVDGKSANQSNQHFMVQLDASLISRVLCLDCSLQNCQAKGRN